MKTELKPSLFQSCGLSEEARERAASAVGAVVGQPSPSVDELIDAAFAAMAPALPAAVLTSMIGLRQWTSPGSLLIHNLPVDTVLPPTPTSVTPGLYDLLPVAKAALLGTVRPLGEPFSYRAEYDGQIVTHVLPSRFGMDLVSSQGSRAVLPFHTEDVHLSPFLPDYVALMCLRPDPDRSARTTLVHSHDIRQVLPPGVEETLRLPLFRVHSPVSFGSQRTCSNPLPVLCGPAEHLQISVELTDMVGLTETAQEALAELSRACQEVAVDVALDSGDVLLIDNRRVLHGRTSFEPRFDGTDRWCIRVLLKAGDLWDWRLYLDGRRLVL